MKNQLEDVYQLAEYRPPILSRHRSALLIVIFVLLAIGNVCMATYSFLESWSGRGQLSKWTLLFSFSFPILLLVPIASLILSLLLAIFSYKDYRYIEKLFPLTVLIAITLELGITVVLLRDLLR